MRILLAATAALLLSAMPTPAQTGSDTAVAVETKTLTYQIDGKTFEGCVSRPAKVTGKVPGVLVAHDWTGYGPFPKARAEQLAGALYQDDGTLFRTRSKAALAELLKQPNVDPDRIGAIGFCFGGATVLELARSGANVAGVVTFHGSLSTKQPAKPGDIKAREILVLHGGQDPMVKPVAVAGFMDEMNAAKVPFRLVAYPEAVHAFTNPEAGNDPAKGTAYNANATEASYAEMEELFAKVFGR